MSRISGLLYSRRGSVWDAIRLSDCFVMGRNYLSTNP
jgi:hypothetical protein